MTRRRALATFLVAAVGLSVLTVPHVSAVTKPTARPVTKLTARPATKSTLRPVTKPSQRPWFRSSKAFWEPITSRPAIDPASNALAAVLSQPGVGRVLNLQSFAVPVVSWDDRSNPEPLLVTNAGDDRWGRNDLEAVAALRVPAGTAPAAGSDAKLVVVDRARNRVIDLWAVSHQKGTWNSGWGGVYALDGDGTSRWPQYAGHGPYDRPFGLPVSRATGSGISSLAGLLTIDDVRRGWIDHALVFATDRSCGPADTGPFRYPATTTDGNYLGKPCLPEGSRIQLDPAIRLDLIPMGRGERMIGEALQRYGAFNIDNGGSRLGFIATLPTSSQQAAYTAVGLIGDYVSLEHLPWRSVRVLSAGATPRP